MSTPFRSGSAVSLVVLASMIAGCAAPQGRLAAPTNFGGKQQGEVALATRAMLALNSGDVASAVTLAERAVEKTPNDAGFRALLGNAYFAAGRFISAEAAFKDSLSLYSNQPKVILKLALAQIALGKAGEAVSFLDAGRAVLDPADYGLALALAGRPGQAVAALEPAARQRSADARVRQNLALAYALSGDWTNARTIASQDVPANLLDSRIEQWMQLATPARPSDQVAALVGVKPAPADQGQPWRLALNKPQVRQAEMAPAPVRAVAQAAAPAPVRVAAPAPPPVRAATDAAPVEAAPPPPRVAEAAPIPAPLLGPVEVHTAAQPAAMSTPAPQFAQAIMAPEPAPEAAPPAPAVDAETAPVLARLAAAAATVRSAVAPFAPKRAVKVSKPVKKVAAKPRPQLRRGTSQTVVQLGSYRSPQHVSAAWATLTQRHPALRTYLPMRARFVSPKGTFWRLSIQGFDSQREAAQHCQALKSRGGSCFVRRFAGDVPVQYASL